MVIFVLITDWFNFCFIFLYKVQKKLICTWWESKMNLIPAINNGLCFFVHPYIFYLVFNFEQFYVFLSLKDIKIENLGFEENIFELLWKSKLGN